MGYLYFFLLLAMQQLIDISCLPGTQQQTCCSNMQQPDRTDIRLTVTVMTLQKLELVH